MTILRPVHGLWVVIATNGDRLLRIMKLEDIIYQGLPIVTNVAQE